MPEARYSTKTVNLEDDGRKIVLSVDENHAENVATVVVLPAFARRRSQVSAVGQYFAMNGIRAIRPDLTNHVGDSSGGIMDFTLSGVISDLSRVSDWAHQAWPGTPHLLVTNSLTFRPTVRYLTAVRPDAFSMVCGLVPVVNVADVVDRAAGRPVWKTVGPGESAEVLGHTVSHNFVADAEATGMGDLATTIEEIPRMQGQVWMFVGTADSWQLREDIDQVVATTDHRVVPIEGAHHDLGRNLSATRQALRAVVEVSQAFLGRDAPVVVPTVEEMIRQARADRGGAA